jgi:tetratricopeptide (TPR) repeat protein
MIAKGEAAFRAKDYDLAFACFDDAVRADPKSALARCWRSRVRVAKLDLEGAIADASEAIRLDPNLADAYSSRAAAYLGLDKSDLAIRDQSKVVDLDPKNANKLAALAVSLKQAKRFAEAVERFKEAFALDPSLLDHAGARTAMALCRIGVKDPKEARRDAEAAVRLDPKMALAHYALGLACWHDGDRGCAEASFEAAARADPTFDAALTLFRGGGPPILP